jgi:DNA modification methylase
MEKIYSIGNAMDVKKILFTNGINCPQLIISSPPYFDLLNYGDNKDQIGYGQKNYDEYLNQIAKVFQDCYDLSTSDATFWLVADTFKKNKEVKLFPFDIVNKLKEKSAKTWILRDVIIWDKGKNLPWNHKGHFKNQHEYILLFVKGDSFKFNVDRIREIIELKKWWKKYPERYNPNGKVPSNVWNFAAPLRGWGENKQKHLCPFPLPLVEKIISLCSDENDWILDPFAGSGSVMAMANEMNRNSIGIDINSEYKHRFETEVSIASERYWKKRKQELEDSKHLFEEFKSINQKLRKMKVAASICTHISQSNKYPFLYYARNKSRNGIEVVVLQNGKIPRIDIKNDALNELMLQAKVNVSVIIEKDKDFIEAMRDDKTYKYQYGKFFCYTSSCKMQNVQNSSERFDYFYSNIGIKIN